MKRTCKLCGEEYETTKYEVLCPKCRYRKCVICGTEFRLSAPYTKVTCSKKCSGIYRKQSGISKVVSQKAKATLLGKYGVTNAAELPGTKTPKICKYCGKEFIPDNFRQVYCTDTHYGACPICGKPVVITKYYKPASCCSIECTNILRERTCTDKYGSPYAVCSDHGKAKSKLTCMDKYGVEHYSKTEAYKLAYANTMQSKYGVSYPLQSPEIRKKWYATNLSKYGAKVPTASNIVKSKLQLVQISHGGFGMQRTDIRTKIEATNLHKYGTKSPLGNDAVRIKAHNTIVSKYGSLSDMAKQAMSKRMATNILKYGVPMPIMNSDILRKAQDTLYLHYGVRNPMESPELVQKSQNNLKQAMLLKYGQPYSAWVPTVKQKISDTCMSKYGVPWYCMTEDCVATNSVRQSIPNNMFALRLEDLGVSCELEKKVGTKFYDICISNKNILIEINPTYTHNSYGNHWTTDGLKSDYHLVKSNMAENNGYRCIHVFDWDKWDKILDMLKPKQTIYARNCEVREVDVMTAMLFENYYHLQGSVRKQMYKYGLFYNGNLVQLMTFGKPRYNKNYEWELLRLCTHSDYRVVGGASKLFKHFVKSISPSSIISYCDKAKFTGDVYTAIGMTLDHISAPAKHWSKSTEHITDNLLRQRGFDQLFGTDYGKGTSNEQLMLDSGWLPVYDCGQAVYTWYR